MRKPISLFLILGIAFISYGYGMYLGDFFARKDSKGFMSGISCDGFCSCDIIIEVKESNEYIIDEYHSPNFSSRYKECKKKYPTKESREEHLKEEERQRYMQTPEYKQKQLEKKQAELEKKQKELEDKQKELDRKQEKIRIEAEKKAKIEAEKKELEKKEKEKKEEQEKLLRRTNMQGWEIAREELGEEKAKILERVAPIIKKKNDPRIKIVLKGLLNSNKEETRNVGRYLLYLLEE